ncbi:hypothetical protein ASD15_13025 [Massilia sp. Root351]|uniref:hypothetical protein n=1 Tax=Massilia sp. Root351 TaxID=1736522 RepID=UPI00070DAD95|nr:hypothetical protein [Massilia sp. Root351]KQV80826.1 hypothetical protein ASD15_13025 [Massilia sp. Root351]
MNQQFEALPFELEGEMGYGQAYELGFEFEPEHEQGLEQERGGRPMGAMRGAARGSGRIGPARALSMGRNPARGPQAGGRPGTAGGFGRPGSPGRPGRPGVPGRPGFPRPRPRPGPAWPYYHGPRYGGLWPYTQVTVLPPEPDGWSGAAFPQDGTPAFDDGNGNGNFSASGDGVGGAYAPPESGEVPPTIAATIARLPAAQRPAYVALGPITAALRDPRATGAGFYLIEFNVNGVQRAYSGQTGNLRRRLQQHALCGQMMGLPLASHSVYVAQSSLPEPQRRAVEYRIHDDMFRTSAGVLTNQRRELEAELFGNEWR